MSYIIMGVALVLVIALSILSYFRRMLDDALDQDAPSFDAPGKPTKRSGRFVCFTYVGKDRRPAVREIRNWKLSKSHIVGWCLDQEDVRTFRLTRIAAWGEWY